ncbi:protein of unknown function [Moritella yayanosii]|uniref:Uncharacterized protein n=1 Tax=Moritella yayanosii TaxID=69539 RepID=A0A330LPM9_9GAMM|nr:protein of unknown function [Moritella yayanosii]
MRLHNLFLFTYALYEGTLKAINIVTIANDNSNSIKVSPSDFNLQCIIRISFIYSRLSNTNLRIKCNH